jgi:hypothetical protein
MRLGNGLITAGLVLVVVGVLVRYGWLGWFGRLPGDIRFESENARVYIPITSMVLVSVVITVVVNLVRRG